MMNLADIEKAIDRVNVFGIPYRVGVFRREKLVSRAFTLTHRGPRSLGSADVPDHITSVVAYVLYSAVPIDYYVRSDLTLNLLTWLKFNDPNRFYYDGYLTLRKEAAVLAGLGTIGRNKLLFNQQFGFHCKIDCIFTDAEFDRYSDSPADSSLDHCADCHECVKACPPGALSEKTMEGFAAKCYAYHLSRPRSFTYQLGHTHCNECINSCPYSSQRLHDMPESIRDRGYRWLIGTDDRELLPYGFVERTVEEVLRDLSLSELESGEVSVLDILKRKGLTLPGGGDPDRIEAGVHDEFTGR